MKKKRTGRTEKMLLLTPFTVLPVVTEKLKILQ